MAGEPNKMRWIGIRPTNPAENIPVTVQNSPTPLITPVEPGPWAASRYGTTRTQVLKSALAGAGWTTLHTVTAGKTLYITSGSIGSNLDTNANIKLAVTDASDVEQYSLLNGYGNSGGPFALANSFPMPPAVPAGYKVRMYSSTGALGGTVQGWEE